MESTAEQGSEASCHQPGEDTRWILQDHASLQMPAAPSNSLTASEWDTLSRDHPDPTLEFLPTQIARQYVFVV